MKYPKMLHIKNVMMKIFIELDSIYLLNIYLFYINKKWKYQRNIENQFINGQFLIEIIVMCSINRVSKTICVYNNMYAHFMAKP